MKNSIRIKFFVILILPFLVLLLVAGRGVKNTQVNPVPTTLNDFFLPGSQPLESGTITGPEFCDNCHGGYDQEVEPAFNWRGSMMAQAQRDPLYLACLAVSNQDAPEVGDLCIRCHTQKGWLEGRSTPTDGSALTADDREGVQCHFCHKTIVPTPIGVNPYPGNTNYITQPANNVDATYDIDQAYLAGMTSVIPPTSANGMYIVDDDDNRRGPYYDPKANHTTPYSPYHSESDMCGTCHDVSNPVYKTMYDIDGNIIGYEPNDFDAPADDFSPYEMFPVERTYSEWTKSAFATTPGGIESDVFGGNKEKVSTCQDCHMKDVTGYGADKQVPLRDDLPLHDMTGGNTFMPDVIASLFPGEVDVAALNAGKERSLYMLQNAANMELNVVANALDVKVTNNTGHKLPSGYPEGRRIWINIKAYNSSTAETYESGHYNFETGYLDKDGTKIYEIKPGIGSNISSVVNLPVGPSFHFVLNNEIFSDNRIPPQGFTNANFEEIQSPPVGYTYADEQYWDNTIYNLPFTPDYVEVTLYYQSTSKEYVEFLRDENVTNDAGQVMYDKWVEFGRSAPEIMNQIVWSPDDITLLKWTGETDSDWNTAANWDQDETPGAEKNVFIPADVTNPPVVSGTSNECNYLNLEAGANLTIPTGTDLNIEGGLLIGANSNGTASLVEFGNLTVNGFIESQFYISENRWHYFSPPLSNQTANPFYGLYLYSYDPLTGTWPNVVDETSLLSNGVGYKVWSVTDDPGTKTIVFRGPGTDIHSGNYNLPVIVNDNYSFVGNPYPSAIDWDHTSWTKSGIGASVYVWDGVQYITWNGTTGDLTDGIIPSMQGFFVSDDGTIPSPVLTVQNEARVNGVDPYKSVESQNVLKIRIEGGDYYDNTFIYFDKNASEAFDSDFDAFKIMGLEEAPQLYTVSDGNNLRINVLPELDADYSVSLNLEVTIDGLYTFQAWGVDGLPGVGSVVLEDKQNNVMIDFMNQQTYSFEAASDDSNDRFVIHFKYSEEDIDTEDDISIYAFGDRIYVQNVSDIISLEKIEVFDVSGRRVMSLPLDQSQKNIIDTELNSGVYIVKVYSSNSLYSEKIFIQ